MTLTAMYLGTRIRHSFAVAILLGMTAAGRAQYKLDWADVGAGGGAREGGPYSMKSGVVQSAALKSDSGGYQAQFHFWSALDEEGQSPNPLADLSVTVGGSHALGEGNSDVVSFITVSNLGPDTATGVQLTFAIPPSLLLQFVTNLHGTTIVQGSNVTCSIASVSPQTSFDVQAVLSVDSQFFDVFTELCVSNFYDTEILIAVNAAEPDSNPANNQAVAALAVTPNLDFGDARTPYPVTRAENGARHRNSSVYHFGTLHDREPEGIHSAFADSDDLGATADEDGIVLPASFPSGSAVTVMVTVPAAGKLDAFFDWNNDNDWTDAGERVTPPGGLAIGPGAIPVTITAPTSAVPTVANQPHARFRFSDVGGLADTGFHAVGEVQDYAFTIASGIQPTVVLTSPTGGSTYIVGSNITLSANAIAATPKSIVSVTFFDNGTQLGTLTANPYSLTVSNLTVGSHTLTVTAVDTAGLTGSSAPVTMSVFDATPPTAGGLDRTFDAGSTIRGGGFPVLAMAQLADGKTIIAGDFTTVHGTARNRIARLNADGSTDQSFGSGLSLADHKVQCVTVQSDGKILIGGYFLNVNGAARTCIARLEANGTLDSTFVCAADDVVYAVAIQADQKILLAGQFSTINGIAHQRIARLNTNGSLDSSFQNLLINGAILSLAVQTNGQVIIGGNFTSIGGQTRNRIARLNSDGTLDATFGDAPLIGANNNVRAIAVELSGRIIIGGDFEQVDGVTHRKVARLEYNGAVDNSFLNASLNDGVNTVVVQSDGKVLVGGAFAYYVPTLVLHGGLSRLNTDGTLDSTFDSGLAGAESGAVDALLLLPHGQILAAGRFTAFDGVPRIGLARVNSDGTLDSDYQNGPTGPDATVRTLALQTDGKLLVGGQFRFVDETAFRGLARLNTDGSLDYAYANGTNSGLNGSVFASALQPDGKLVIVGDFTQVQGSNRVGVARMDGTGKLDGGFGCQNSGASGPPQAVALQPDGRVLIGGSFSTVNGTNRSSVARLTASGLVDNSFDVGTGPNSLVTALAVQGDGKVLVGGWFTTFAGQPRGGLARVLSNGSLDTSFLNGLLGANHRVYAIAVQPDGKIIVAGEFSGFNGVTRDRIARLLPDGNLDSSFSNGLAQANAQVLACVLQPDEKIVVGGAFGFVNGVSRNRVARLLANGEFDTEFLNNLSGANDQVWAINRDAQGRIFIGGQFTTVNGFSCDRVARLLGGDPTLDGGDAPDTYRTRFADDGPRHVVKSGPCLGVRVDAEADAAPDPAANGDDAEPVGLDDEDGLISMPTLVPGTSATLLIRCSIPVGEAGFLDGWVDFDHNGVFDHPAERVLNSVVMSNGVNLRSVQLPSTAAPGATFARFRISSTGGLLPTGLASDGEVEDYATTIAAPKLVNFAQFPHGALGSATISSNSGGMLISNLGSNGQDGVSIGLFELTRAATLKLSPVSLSSNGASLSLGLTGMMNDVSGRSLGRLFLNNSNGVIELGFMDWDWWWLRMEVYSDDTLIGSGNVTSNGVAAMLSGTVQLTGVKAGDANPTASEWTLWELDFANSVSFSPPGLAGNRVKIMAVNAPGALQNLERLDLTGANLSSVLIEQETAPAFQPNLRIGRSAGQIQLNWDTRTSVLQCAPTVAGPWTTLTEGTSSHGLAVNQTNASQLYRVVIPELLRNCSLRKAADSNYVCQRNILLVIADDVGIDQLGKYRAQYHSAAPITYATSTANPAAQMDNLQRLVRSGVTFLNAWSSPLCSPTRACLYTGNQSFRHGVYATSPDAAALPDSFTLEGATTATKTIANVMGNAGYATGFFGKWHLGGETVGPTTYGSRPVHFGWDYFSGALAGELRSYTDWDKIIEDTSGVIFSSAVTGADNYATTTNTTDALNWITAQTGPWMATVAFNAPHEPFEWPTDDCWYHDRTDISDRAKYRAMLECLDQNLGRLLDGIPKDTLDKTTIIFMGDNGTDKDITDHFTSANFPGYGNVNHAKASVYEGGVKVPLIVADGFYVNAPLGVESPAGWGRVVSPDRDETALVQTLDVFATCAGIGRGDGTSGADSVSLLPYLANAAAASQREFVFTESRADSGFDWTCGATGWTVAVAGKVGINGEIVKLIISDYDSVSNSGSKSELYNLTDDPWETSDIQGAGALAIAYENKLKAALPGILSGWSCKP